MRIIKKTFELNRRSLIRNAFVNEKYVTSFMNDPKAIQPTSITPAYLPHMHIEVFLQKISIRCPAL